MEMANGVKVNIGINVANPPAFSATTADTSAITSTNTPIYTVILAKVNSNFKLCDSILGYGFNGTP